MTVERRYRIPLQFAAQCANAESSAAGAIGLVASKRYMHSAGQGVCVQRGDAIQPLLES